MRDRKIPGCLVAASGMRKSPFRVQEAGSIGSRDAFLVFDATDGRSYTGTGTSVTDVSETGNTGTLTNGVGYSPEAGGTFTFDASNAYISVPHNANQNPSSVTLIAWVRPAASWSVLGSIVGKGGFSGYTMRLNSGLALQFTDRNSNIGGGTGPIIRSKWAHVACTASPSGTVVYTYGIYRNRNAIAFGGNISTDDVHVGANGAASPAQFFNGDIASVLMFSRELTSSEIYQHYLSTRSRYSNE